MVNLFPENDPGGPVGESLRQLADSANQALGPYVEASDRAVFAGLERGQLVDPDSAVAAATYGIEGDLNAIGGEFRDAEEWLNAANAGLIQMEHVWERVVAMTPDEFEAARPQLEASFPGINWAGYYQRDQLRDPGRIGRLFRPVLRFLRLEPPFWR